MQEEMIHLHHHTFKKFLSHEEILKAIEKMGKQMSADFKHEKPVFLVILKGAFMFAGELLKVVNRDCDLEFIRIKSYQGLKSTGQFKVEMDSDLEVKDRTVIILEDIVDSGKTIQYLHAELQKIGVKDIKFATLFLKPEAYQKSFPLDYVGLEIPNEFVVGFGLDYDESGRGLKDLYIKE